MNRSQATETPLTQERLSPKDWISQTRPLLATLAQLIDKTIACLDHFIKIEINYFEDIDGPGKTSIPLIYDSINDLVKLYKDLENLQVRCNQFARTVRSNSLSAARIRKSEF
jgi:hypothetical protein